MFLSPGLFGFVKVGSYDYFCHIEKALRQRFHQAGRDVRVHVINVQPTASIRRRATTLHQNVEKLALDDGPIHLLGHSTGGLDARLVASPSVHLMGQKGAPKWTSRLRSVTTINTPHYGTPLASFFATVSGQRLLYAVSALTVAALTLGAPPLALTSSIIAAFGRVDKMIGFEVRMLDGLIDRVVQTLDDASSHDLREYLKNLREDQGAIIQLSPESMDLFEAGVEDNPNVHYQCVATYAPSLKLTDWVRVMLSPWSSVSAPVFVTLQRLTSLENEKYPCSPRTSILERALLDRFNHVPPEGASDGIVPLRSQVWGKLVWAGFGDHLDIVGHFSGKGSGQTDHTDWLCSGSRFDLHRFNEMLDAVVAGMLESEAKLSFFILSEPKLAIGLP